MCAIVKGAATCVAEGSIEYQSVRGDMRMHCTRQEDCSPGDACYYASGEADFDARTYCGSYSREFMGSVVCDPTGPGPCKHGDTECEELNRCQVNDDLTAVLPWLGVL